MADASLDAAVHLEADGALADVAAVKAIETIDAEGAVLLLLHLHMRFFWGGWEGRTGATETT